MDKVSNGMPPPQITELFAQRNEHTYSLRRNTKFLQPFVNSILSGTGRVSYLGQRFWV